MAKVKKKREISQENIRDDYSLNMLIKLLGCKAINVRDVNTPNTKKKRRGRKILQRFSHSETH